MLGTLVYLLLRGGQIHERAAHATHERDAALSRYLGQSGGGPGNPSLDELERLAALHRQGSLSDAEFQSAKDRLLTSQR